MGRGATINEMRGEGLGEVQLVADKSVSTPGPRFPNRNFSRPNACSARCVAQAAWRQGPLPLCPLVVPPSRLSLPADDTYGSLIPAASPLVQSISFPEPQNISFDTSTLWSTASACTSQESSRLSTIGESLSSDSPSIISSSSLSPSLTPTTIASVSVPASSPSLLPTVHSLIFQVPSSTTPLPREAPPPIPPIVTGKASPQLVPIRLTPPHTPPTPSTLSDTISFLSSYRPQLDGRRAVYSTTTFTLIYSHIFFPSVIFNTVLSVKLALIQDTPFDAHIAVPSLIR